MERTAGTRPQANAGTAPTTPEARLKAGALGFHALLMQGVTHIAPAVGLLLTIQVITFWAGVTSPLAYLIAFAIVLMLGISLMQLARHLPSAGGYYTYVSRTVHPRAGFLTAWLYFLYDPVGTALNLAFMGYFLEAALQVEYGIRFPCWWPDSSFWSWGRDPSPNRRVQEKEYEQHVETENWLLRGL